MSDALFTPEFRLAIDFCSRCFIGSRIVEAPSSEIDWPSFLELCRVHRIQGLAHKGLTVSRRDCPETVRDALRAAAAGVTAANLQAKFEYGRLLERFDAAGIDVLILKGLPLSVLAYGDPTLKAGIDIDLLIAPVDLGLAAKTIRQMGWYLAAPGETPDDIGLRRWHREWKESVWLKRSSPSQIDLHTAAADHPRLIPSIDVHSPRQSVDLGDGVTAPTLADDELFTYLTVHGASSAWFRLKWIVDFAAVLSPLDSSSIARIYTRTQQLGAGRCAGQALLLAHCLFGTLDGNPDLLKRLQGGRAIHRLYRTALKMLAASVEPTGRWLGTLPIHRTQFSLLPGTRFKLSELARQTRKVALRVRS